MRFSSSLFTLYTLWVAPFTVACIDVTCAERGTCPPGATSEPSSDAALTRPSGSGDGSVGTGAVSVDGSVDTRSEPGPSGCVTSCASRDASAWMSSAVTSTDGGRTNDGGNTSAVLSSSATALDTDTCVEVCECGSDACSPSLEPVEAGPPGCSPEQAAACVSPTSICIWENEAPACVECRGNYDCAAPNSVCVATRCEVCDLVSGDGCFPDAPFCVAVGASTSIDGGSATTGLVSTTVDGGFDVGSPSADAGASATRACVECRNHNDCDAAAPLCSEGSCVQCLADADCGSPDAPRCDTATNSCTGCDAVGQCSRFDDTPACNLNDGKCVECTAAEAAICEDFACQTTPGAGQYTCSEQEAGDAGRCQPCVSDAACDTGLACILENFGDQNTEWICLPTQPDGGCTTLRQLTSTLAEATTADGAIGNFCKPPRTSCAAVRHYATSGLEEGDWCQSDDDCGLPGVADGFCLPYDNNENTRLCTYACVAGIECRTSVICDLVDGSGEVAVCTPE